MAGRNLSRRNNLSSRSRSFPEGPYEYEDASLRPGVANSGMLTFLDFYEKFEYEMESSLTLKRGYSEIPILSKLVGDHLLGKTTTKSSLIGSSGMSYGTALRAINSMEQKGLIVKRPRTITGKSFSLHPSEKILHEWSQDVLKLYWRILLEKMIKIKVPTIFLAPPMLLAKYYHHHLL